MKHKLRHFDDKTPIDKIHLTYLKLKLRQDERRKKFNDFINHVPSLIKPTNKRYNLLHKIDSNKTGKITIEFNNRFNDWCYSTDFLYLKGREEILDYYEDTELKFELGEKFKRLESLNKNYFCSYLFEVILSKLENTLQKNKYFEDITQIVILNNIKYLFISRNYKSELIYLDEKNPIII